MGASISKELQIRLEGVLDLVRSCESIYEDLVCSFSGSEFESIYKNYLIFDKIIRAFKAVLSQDICILFDRNSAFSLIKVLNISLNNFKSIQWSRPLNKKDLICYREEFDNYCKSESLDKIKKVRNKYYSHLDKNAPQSISIELEEYHKLILFAKKVVEKLFSHLNSASIQFYSKRFSGSSLVKDLSKYNLIEKKVRESYFDCESFIKTSDLIKISHPHWKI